MGYRSVGGRACYFCLQGGKLSTCGNERCGWLCASRWQLVVLMIDPCTLKMEAECSSELTAKPKMSTQCRYQKAGSTSSLTNRCTSQNQFLFCCIDNMPVGSFLVRAMKPVDCLSPLRLYCAVEWRYCSIHSYARHYMELSASLHTSAAFTPGDTAPMYTLEGGFALEPGRML